MSAPTRRAFEDLPLNSFLTFPPGQGNVLVPIRPARAAALGITMYTASKPIPLAAQRLLWLVARLGGQRLLPGVRRSWDPPLPIATLRLLWAQWAELAGADLDAVAVYNRPQPSRPGVALILCARTGGLLIRLRADPSELEREIAVSRAAVRLTPTTFQVPALRGTGAADGWHWAAFDVMSFRPHRAELDADSDLTGEVMRLVEDVVPRPPGTPAHWRGAHGDLTPWNLRRAGSRRPWLIDWEDAAWAPPGLDDVYYAASRAGVSPRRSKDLTRLAPFAEAAAWAGAKVRSRPDDDPKITARMLAVFDSIT